MASKIRHNEFRGINLTNDFVVYSINVFALIHSQRLVPRLHNAHLKPIGIDFIQFWLKMHCYKAVSRR